MAVALITGINGQDGSYLAELLLAKGYEVCGTVRDLESSDVSRIGHLLDNLTIIQWNLADEKSWAPLLEELRPNEIYNLAARASSATLFDDPVLTAKVNGLAVTRILEAIRLVDPGIRLCQASSREIFGGAATAPQDENTPVRPRNPYGAAKQYADTLIRVYREQYRLFACSAVLFNHESPRRSPEYVTRKVTSAAVKIKLGLADRLHLANLSGQRDWGFAGDSVRALWRMLRQSEADDYVIATGEFHTVRELCEIAFSSVGLDYRDFVVEYPDDNSAPEPVPIVGNSEKARRVLEWAPTVSFAQLIEMMVEADLDALS
jgi:GDPmannose 4,6-dehydratase